MPTAKRERKRAGRQARLAALEAAKRRRARRRQSIIVGALVVVILGVLYLVNMGKSSSAKKSTSGTSTTVAGLRSTGTPTCPKTNGSSPRTVSFSQAPPMCITLSRGYSADVKTDAGSFTIQLSPQQAPRTVNNFVFLARYHLYDGTVFHRVIPGFVVQGGDPTGTGTGGPGYKFADELPPAGSYKIGSVAMANSGPNTDGSQFFVITGQQGVQLQPQYSLFGQVTSGMNVVDTISAGGGSSGTPTVKHHILSVTIVETP